MMVLENSGRAKDRDLPAKGARAKLPQSRHANAGWWNVGDRPNPEESDPGRIQV